uniref:Putative secreted peptide n=1 Tax=Rhipicephalus pulchellus TaxID=72859 RepID=L7MCF5_RHIPC
MSLTYLLLWGCIISALLQPSQGCKNCCGSCTRPQPPSCRNWKEHPRGKQLYFPDKAQDNCVAASSDQCKGKFYDKQHECRRCCQSYFTTKQG